MPSKDQKDIKQIGGRDNIAGTQSVLQYPPESSMYNVLFQFINYDSKGGFVKLDRTSVENVEEEIILPLPENLIESFAVNYAAQDLGIFAAGDKAGADFREMINQDGAGAAIKGLLGSLSGAAEATLRSVAESVSPGLGAFLDVKLGNVNNPYKTSIFEDISLRTHEFSWTIRPRSLEESETIKKIVQSFNKHSLPTLDNNVRMNFPDECYIYFVGTPHLYKIFKCVISNVSADYAPDGNQFFKTDYPAAIKLSITLQEVEQVTREVYEQGIEEDDVLQ